MVTIEDKLRSAYNALSLALDHAVVNNLPIDRISTARNEILDAIVSLWAEQEIITKKHLT
jgi:hypothetical protein